MAALNTPRQFGPSIRMPCRFATAVKPVLRRWPGLVHLGEAGGEDDGGAAALLAERVERLDGELAGHGDDAEVGRFRQVGDGGVGGEALDGLAPRVHRVDGALEALLLHVGDGPAADPRRLVRGADQRDRARPHQRVQRREIRRRVAAAAASARMAFPLPVPRKVREAGERGKGRAAADAAFPAASRRRQPWALGESTMQPPRPRSLSHTACAADCDRPVTRAR